MTACRAALLVLAFAVAVPFAAAQEPETCEVPENLDSSTCPRCTEPCRTARITYVARLSDLPAGAKEAVLWFPVPLNSPHQNLDELTIDTAGTVEYVTDDRHGNQVARVVFVGEALAKPEAKLRFRAHRQAVRNDLSFMEGRPDPKGRSEAAAYLEPVDGTAKTAAASVIEGKVGAVARARAIHAHLTAEKTETPDADRAAAFVAFARAAEVPARIEVGVLLPRDAQRGTLSGPHLWASFFVPVLGWVPVDVAQSRRNAERAAAWFGGADCDRVAFSSGSGISFGQAGGPVGIFFAPYAEVDGKPHAGVQAGTSFDEESRDDA